jgi:hypothetical protein
MPYCLVNNELPANR